MWAYLGYSTILPGFVFPVLAHAVWSPQGFLSPTALDPFMGIGVLDFAGSGVIHATGGMAALVASYFLGPRKGRFVNIKTGQELSEPRKFPGHSQSLQLAGTILLWFGCK